MKNLILLLVILIITATVIFGSYTGVALAADLCGGTNGNGERLSVWVKMLSLLS